MPEATKGSPGPGRSAGPEALAAQAVLERHRDLEPHLEFMTRLAREIDDDDEPALRSLLTAALDCTDDEVLPFLEASREHLYPVLGAPSEPARQLLSSQHRAIGRVRQELRLLAAGDLREIRRREEVRQRLYGLVDRLRSLSAQQVEVCLPLLDPSGQVTVTPSRRPTA